MNKSNQPNLTIKISRSVTSASATIVVYGDDDGVAEFLASVQDFTNDWVKQRNGPRVAPTQSAPCEGCG